MGGKTIQRASSKMGIAFLGFLFTPAYVYALTITETITKTTNFFGGAVVNIVFLLATAFLIWGVVQLIAQADDPQARKKAKTTILWSIIGLTVLAAGWSLAAILVDFFKSGGVGIPTPSWP